MPHDLTDQAELFDALDGLHAYDSGCTDSGIKDEVLKENVGQYLRSLPEDEFRLVLSRFIRETFLTEDALSKRYGLADVREFLDWLRDEMGFDV